MFHVSHKRLSHRHKDTGKDCEAPTTESAHGLHDTAPFNLQKIHEHHESQVNTVNRLQQRNQPKLMCSNTAPRGLEMRPDFTKSSIRTLDAADASGVRASTLKRRNAVKRVMMPLKVAQKNGLGSGC